MTATNAEPASPDYLSGIFAPVPDEITAFDLEVEGTLPPELDGLYLRNGANPLPGVDPGHNFAGPGMVHGVRLSGGKASWYRNRWVQTPALKGARVRRADGTRDLTASSANTSILGYNSKIFALVENALPIALTEELDTAGPYDFNGALQRPMTAHPKVDPVTGRLHFFDYDALPPFATYHVASPDGRLLRSVPISVTGPTMMHDFAITEHHVVWLDMPVTFDRSRMTLPGLPYGWSDEYPARIGVMPHTGDDDDIRWFPVKPGYAFHVSNAYEDADGRIVIEAVNYDRASFNIIWGDLGGHSVLSDAETARERSKSASVLYRWTLDPASGRVSEEMIDDLAVEFPTINPERSGREYRYAYAVSAPLLSERDGPRVVKYDRQTGNRSEHGLDAGWIPGEAIFVPGVKATAEDDGWLLSIVAHATEDRAQLLVQDAADPAIAPVATVNLPRRVPLGFHGAWIASAR